MGVVLLADFLQKLDFNFLLIKSGSKLALALAIFGIIVQEETDRWCSIRRHLNIMFVFNGTASTSSAYMPMPNIYIIASLSRSLVESSSRIL